jgi:hypothetical protein
MFAERSCAGKTAASDADQTFEPADEGAVIAPWGRCGLIVDEPL